MILLKIWARGTSTVGTGAEAKPGARNVPINIGGVTVSPVSTYRYIPTLSVSALTEPFSRAISSSVSPRKELWLSPVSFLRMSWI